MPKLLYLVTEDWYFCSHRLPMARAARAAGFEVVVATRVGTHGPAIEAEGFTLRPLSWRRGGNGLGAVLGAVWEIAALYRRERPDLVHHVAVKPVVLGGLAAWLAGGSRVVNALTGLGFVFIGRSPLLWPVRRLMGWVLRRPGSRLVLQNQDDRAFLVGAGFADPARVTVIRGSGIDLEHFTPLPEPPAPDGSVTVAFVGRMLTDKGVPVLVEALRRVRARGLELRLLLAGDTDPENPTAIPRATLEAWSREPGIRWLGPVADVRTVWRAAAIAVLPSRREGLPKSLMEAAACGRALVATDVPGCREIARADENALLVPPDDPAALAEALTALTTDPARRARFAAASRRLVESDLAAEAVGAQTLALYRQLLGTGGN
jgi:glycosyltransferase involved in cell wall biosynthesis